ncbi:uncharacterized protein LOC121735935 [Aricia agestis]|uniref:uncharacterized protein LOC121735935 n=1 Tax=Aricia agestis TaxID=91739 RepID=UPI001C2083AB|nr:uncharacterized protein LOC121735935 [Aricia agestis]
MSSMRVIVASILLCMNLTPAVNHVPDPPKRVNKAEELCELADSCMHDTIPVCGRMGEVRRTFLDLCDLIEYGCDTNQIFAHVEGNAQCPDPEYVRPKPKVKIPKKGSRRKQFN